MQSLSFRLTKRLYNSKPLFRISSNFVAHASSATSTPPPPPPPSPPIPAPSTLRNLLTAPWFATQSRGISLSGSDVRVGNLDGNRGCAHEVQPRSVAGYATVATTADDIKSKERKSGLGKEAKTKREQLLKATAVASLVLLYPNTYSLLLANFFVFWHLKAGIEEILADYVHHAMTREFITISLRLFLIIAMKDVLLKFVFV
ncbi:succinate dehydrogenase subunit 4, mitochondrial [Vigna radiata var. radiata]|uniref:Succinate dehydrogenase subunit 4, mitochondrial n=1 Tax=Vigna radiata var. radiata TaxID=3916 RepID=A0A1S3TVW8_VIGRR|nr:succinate dehydrogenase subunit 4, mitochondrial [Vigna radiata var. radiata]